MHLNSRWLIVPMLLAIFGMSLWAEDNPQRGLEKRLEALEAKVAKLESKHPKISLTGCHAVPVAPRTSPKSEQHLKCNADEVFQEISYFSGDKVGLKCCKLAVEFN
jgi:hypothetical protein